MKLCRPELMKHYKEKLNELYIRAKQQPNKYLDKVLFSEDGTSGKKK